MTALCPRCARVTWLRSYCWRCDLVLLPREPETTLRQLDEQAPARARGLDQQIDAELLRLRMGEPEAARDGLARIVDEHPGLARARLALAIAEDAVDGLAAALRQTSAALRLNPLQYAPPKTPAERLAAAAVLQRRAQLEENANDPAVQMELGRHRVMCGAPAAALEAYAAALHETPEDPEVLTATGVVLRVMGKQKEAVDLHQRAVAAQPDFALAHNNLAAAHADLGRLEEAAVAAERAVELDGGLGHAWASVAAAYLDSEQPLRAIEACIEAETRAPELTPTVAAVRGAAHLLREETDKAREQATRGLRHALAHRAPQLGFVVGATLDRREQPTAAEEARRPLWAMLELDPEPRLDHRATD